MSGCLVWLGPDLQERERERESRAVSVEESQSAGPDYATVNTVNTRPRLLSCLLARQTDRLTLGTTVCSLDHGHWVTSQLSL